MIFCQVLLRLLPACLPRFYSSAGCPSVQSTILSCPRGFHPLKYPVILYKKDIISFWAVFIPSLTIFFLTLQSVEVTLDARLIFIV